MTTRNQIIELCIRAGIAAMRLQEIKDGCDADRICRILFCHILCGQIDAMQPGVGVLSDSDAAYTALDLAIGCRTGRLSLDAAENVSDNLSDLEWIRNNRN